MIKEQYRRREPKIPVLWWSGGELSARMILEECVREFGSRYAPTYLEKRPAICFSDLSRTATYAFPGDYIVMDPLHGPRALTEDDLLAEFEEVEDE